MRNKLMSIEGALASDRDGSYLQKTVRVKASTLIESEDGVFFHLNKFKLYRTDGDSLIKRGFEKGGLVLVDRALPLSSLIKGDVISLRVEGSERSENNGKTKFRIYENQKEGKIISKKYTDGVLTDSRPHDIHLYDGKEVAHFGADIYQQIVKL